MSTLSDGIRFTGAHSDGRVATASPVSIRFTGGGLELRSDDDRGTRTWPYDQLHGSGGPLRITSIKRRHELIEALITAAGKYGVPRTSDFNGTDQEGVGYYQLTTRNGWRVSAADARSPAAMPVSTRCNAWPRTIRNTDAEDAPR